MDQVDTMILLQLKEQTQISHKRLEDGLALLDSEITLADYRELLQKFLGFYQPIEASLATVQHYNTFVLDLEPRRKAGLLRQDLQTLGVSQTQTLPQCQELPELMCAAHMWGCFYVLEGATLGGRLITRHMKKRFGLIAEDSCAFFNSYGSNVGPMWQQFTSALTTYTIAHQEHQPLIIHSACETFASLSLWLLRK